MPGCLFIIKLKKKVNAKFLNIEHFWEGKCPNENFHLEYEYNLSVCNDTLQERIGAVI